MARASNRRTNLFRYFGGMRFPQTSRIEIESLSFEQTIPLYISKPPLFHLLLMIQKIDSDDEVFGIVKENMCTQHFSDLDRISIDSIVLEAV
jgi:hypothetical protein